MFNDGVVATIYNWKNGPASMGENGTNPVDIETWHSVVFTSPLNI